MREEKVLFWISTQPKQAHRTLFDLFKPIINSGPALHILLHVQHHTSFVWLLSHITYVHFFPPILSCQRLCGVFNMMKKEWSNLSGKIWKEMIWFQVFNNPTDQHLLMDTNKVNHLQDRWNVYPFCNLARARLIWMLSLIETNSATPASGLIRRLVP